MLRDAMNAEMMRLAGLVGAQPKDLPAWSMSADARPYVEERDGLMSWVVNERGVTWQLANAWGLQVRIPYVELRRLDR